MLSLLPAVLPCLAEQGTSDPQRKSDHAALTEIQHLVKLEQRSLEEFKLNEQAELSLNVRPRLRLTDMILLYLFRRLYQNDRITKIRRHPYHLLPGYENDGLGRVSSIT